MKKIFSVFAIFGILTFMGLSTTSCEKTETGDVMYHVDEGDFFDNMDILAYSIDKGFEDAGFTSVSTHYWKLTGEKKACNKKATEVFQNRCKAIDKDRSQILLPLALKGVTVTLIYTYQGDYELSTYTFVEEDM